MPNLATVFLAVALHGAWPDPSLCRNLTTPTPPGLYGRGIYHSRLNASGKPVCYEPSESPLELIKKLFQEKK